MYVDLCREFQKRHCPLKEHLVRTAWQTVVNGELTMKQPAANTLQKYMAAFKDQALKVGEWTNSRELRLRFLAGMPLDLAQRIGYKDLKEIEDLSEVYDRASAMMLKE